LFQIKFIDDDACRVFNKNLRCLLKFLLTQAYAAGYNRFVPEGVVRRLTGVAGQQSRFLKSRRFFVSGLKIWRA